MKKNIGGNSKLIDIDGNFMYEFKAYNYLYCTWQPTSQLKLAAHKQKKRFTCNDAIYF